MFIIGFGFMMYIILDGFTLSIGILSPFLTAQQRDIAMSTVLPVWDGNQTWLVFSLAALYGMFPGAFSALLPKIYLPAILLALLLLFRGICFEFRLKAKRGIKNFDRLFALASFCIALIHGYLAAQVIVGYAQPHFFEQGMTLKLITAITTAFGYMLLGAMRLMLKTSNNLYEQTRKIAIYASRLLAILGIIVLIMTILHNDRAFGEIRSVCFIGLGILLVIVYAFLQLNLVRKKHYLPYWLGVLIFVSLVLYVFPYMVPYQLTYWEAAASPVTLKFTLIIAVIMIPLLLLYTSYNYFVFRGKVREKIHY